MVDFSKIKDGDIVTVRKREGGTRTGTVNEVSDDIKNGMPGIGYVDLSGESYWCYDSQILRHTPAQIAA